jgi:hypothetical protein
MNRDDKVLWLTVGGFILAIIAVVFTIFPILQYFNVPPADLVILLPYLKGTIILIFVGMPVFLIYRKRKTITQYFGKEYFRKLQTKIMQEMKLKSSIVDLSLLKTDFTFLQNRVFYLTTNISNRKPPTRYTYWKGGTLDREKHRQIWYIGEVENNGDGQVMTEDDAKKIAQILTEISYNKRFRRNKVLFYLIP